MAASPKHFKDQPDQEKLLPCQVSYYLDDKALRGTSSCFNELGMLVLCRQPAPLNTRLKLILQFPHIQKPIEVHGEVVWTNVYGPDDTITPRGMGVKFTREDPDVLKMLGDLSLQYDGPMNIYQSYFS